MKIRAIVLLITLICIALAIIIFILPKKSPTEIGYTPSPQSVFEDKSTYTNRQANFAIDYPQHWELELGESDDENTRGIRLQGSQGYIDIYWGPEYMRGGCDSRVSSLQLQSEAIEVCNFIQDDNSEIWNQIIKNRGDTIFWSNAYAASPSASTREVILEIYKTLRFLPI